MAWACRIIVIMSTTRWSRKSDVRGTPPCPRATLAPLPLLAPGPAAHEGVAGNAGRQVLAAPGVDFVLVHDGHAVRPGRGLAGNVASGAIGPLDPSILVAVVQLHATGRHQRHDAHHQPGFHGFVLPFAREMDEFNPKGRPPDVTVGYRGNQAMRSAAFTREGVKGMSRMRAPVASCTALASAAAAGPCVASPVPRKGCPGRSITSTSIVRGTCGNRIIG